MERSLLLKELENSFSLSEIARRHGLGLTTVRYWVRKHGLRSLQKVQRGSSTSHPPENFSEIVQVSFSIAGVIRALGRAVQGTNYRQVRRWVRELDLDTSHWRGQSHGTSWQNKRTPLDEMLVADSRHRITVHRKRRLINEGVLKNECASCGMGPVWRGKPLVLRLDHVNGDRYDNRKENLRFLCPNCDSQTETFCGRNRRRSHAHPEPRGRQRSLKS